MCGECSINFINCLMRLKCLVMFNQVVIDEFEQRIEEMHSKGVADDEAAQKASKVSVTARSVKGSKSAKTPGNFIILKFC